MITSHLEYSKNLTLELIEKYSANSYNYFEGLHTLTVIADDLISVVKYLKEEKGFIFLVDQYFQNNEIFLLLLNLEEHQRILLKTTSIEEPKKELRQIFSKTSILDKRTYFGNERNSKKYETIFPPLKQLYGENEERPSYRTSSLFESEDKLDFSLDLELINSKIFRSHIENGFYHIGIEQSLVGLNILEGLEVMKRAFGVKSYDLCWAYAKNIEDSFGITVPDKGKVLRMFFCELFRIYDHIQGLNLLLKTLRFDILQKEVHDLSCLTLKFFRDAFGSENLGKKIVIGGVDAQFSTNWIGQALNFIKTCGQTVNKIQKVLLRNRLWTEETNIFGIRAVTAIEYGFSGPLLRASGVNYDLRKTNPIYYYQDVDFEIPLGINGDIYDVYIVRFEEIKQSASILSQILDSIPSGSTHLDLISFDKITNNTKFYAPLEGSRGECGIILDIDSNKISQAKIVSSDKNFFHSIDKRLKGYNYREAIMLIRSGHLNIEEIDL